MDTNVIRITNENDSLILKDNEIHAFADNNEHVYNLSTLSRLKIISSSSELDNIEKYLVLYIGDDTAIFINSDHKCFQPFLFKQLNSNLSLNHKRIIDAMGCTGDATFEIYLSLIVWLEIACMDCSSELDSFCTNGCDWFY